MGKNIFNKFIKFILTGIVNTIFGYSVFSLLLFVGLHYSLALLIATIAGVLFNFKTIGSFVFNNRNNGLIFRFVAVYAVTYAVNVSALGVLAHFSFNLYLAGLLLQVPIAFLSFGLNYRFVFMGSKTYATHQHCNTVL